MKTLQKHMADVIGHGMSEKCERHAGIAEEYYAKEIAELKELLVSERSHWELRYSEEFNENVELKCHVERLREVVSTASDGFNEITREINYSDAYSLASDHLDLVEECIKETPAQSLKHIQADVIQSIIDNHASCMYFGHEVVEIQNMRDEIDKLRGDK